VCEVMHKKGTLPWECMTSYNSVNIKAEKFWEAAAAVGCRTLILKSCLAAPVNTDMETNFFNSEGYTPDRAPSDSYVNGKPQQYLHINTGVDGVTLSIHGTKVKGALFASTDAVLPGARQIAENTYEFDAYDGSRFYDPGEIEKYSWVVITSDRGVRVVADAESAQDAREIKVGEWSDVITRELMTNSGRTCLFHFRARLEMMDAEKNEYVVYIPAVKNLLREASSEAAADEMMDIAEVHSVYGGFDGGFDEDKYYDVQVFNDEWRKQVLLRSLENHEYDIVLDFAGFIDTVNHIFKSDTEFGDEAGKARADAIMLRGYKLVDDYLGWLLDNVADDDTIVCVVSDHGSVGHTRSSVVNQFSIMKQAGLTAYKDAAGIVREDNVDWSKTKAYAVGTCHIFVNLEGREPCGIVKPEDYDKVVKEIIDALYTYGRGKDGISGIAFAVPGAQAGFMGLGGECCGDVVFGVNGAAGGYYGGVHAQQVPSANNGTGGDIRSLCIMSGKGFKKGHTVVRPTDITDIAPTLCYAAGLPQPKHATGGVVFDAYE